MSRNKENNPLSPQQRANASILSLSRTPQSEDFFTDSILDASRIPTPNPKRQAFSAAYKSRRALRNPITLKGAWNATAGPSQRSISDNEVAPTRQPLPDPPPVEIKKQGPAPHQDQRRTPSPPRSRPPVELKSPTSEVSQDLTDVYQRIADEEDLNAQENELADEQEEDYTEDSILNPYSVTGTEDLQQNGRLVESPISRRDSDVPVPSRFLSNGNKENLEEVTSMSEASGLSFLKEITDQKLAAALTPHTVDRAKDRARLERAINNDKPITFRGHGLRTGLTTENLQRNGSLAESLKRRDSSTGSVTTERSEPAPNVPRIWGTKSKAGKEWLRSRREGSVNGIKNSPVLESSQVDWGAAAAEVALPSVEHSSTPMVQSSRGSTPSSLHRQTSLDRIRQWELNDFTGQSLQVSNSPPVRIKPSVPDLTRDKEIEGLEKRAVATSRLGEIRRMNSNELIRKLSRSPPGGLQTRETDSAATPVQRKGVTFVDDGEQIPGTPIVIYRSSSSLSKADTQKPEEQPDESRKQSHDQLQRLARAMSASPRPSPSPEEWSLIGPEEDPKRANGQLENSMQHAQNSDTSREPSKRVVEVEATPQSVKISTAAKTPVVTGAWTDTILPDTIKTVKKPEQGSKYAQTPHVNAGGWVDTPLPGKRHSSAPAPIPIEEETEEFTDDIRQDEQEAELQSVPGPSSQAIIPKQPEMPTSALASLLERAKRRLVSQDVPEARDGNDTLNLGDATIESLEDLLTLDATDMTTLIRIGAEAEAHDQLLSDPLAEAELLERLGSKLERLRTNIHDARKGISKLEHQVTHPGMGQQQLESTSKDASCEACGGPRTMTGVQPFSTDYKLYLALPIPRLFDPRRTDLGHRLPRPTRLGWFILLAWVWYISESTMCELYCHPLYAEHYEWPREHEPVFPWVLPTMLWRWSGFAKVVPARLGPLWTVFIAFVRVVGQIFGLSDGFVEGPYRGGGFQGSGSAGSGSSSGGGGIDMSMMNDEYI